MVLYPGVEIAQNFNTQAYTQEWQRFMIGSEDTVEISRGYLKEPVSITGCMGYLKNFYCILNIEYFLFDLPWSCVVFYNNKFQNTTILIIFQDQIMKKMWTTIHVTTLIILINTILYGIIYHQCIYTIKYDFHAYFFSFFLYLLIFWRLTLLTCFVMYYALRLVGLYFAITMFL